MNIVDCRGECRLSFARPRMPKHFAIALNDHLREDGEGDKEEEGAGNQGRGEAQDQKEKRKTKIFPRHTTLCELTPSMLL